MAIDISSWRLTLAFVLLLIPLVISFRFRLKLIKTTLISVLRMSLQLFLVAIFLKYIFYLNNPLLNFAWLLLMIFTAVISATGKLNLKPKIILLPITTAFTFSTVSILLYFNYFIIHLDQLFSARYLIGLGGMMLGNVLSMNIIALNTFYQSIRTDYRLFLFRLSLGATKEEALLPFLRHSFKMALLPILAKTATTGIVSLPGMMTGQIIAGSSPTTAIKYQIAIMIAIFVAGTLSVLLTLIFSLNKCFTPYHTLKPNLFKSPSFKSSENHQHK